MLDTSGLVHVLETETHMQNSMGRFGARSKPVLYQQQRHRILSRLSRTINSTTMLSRRLAAHFVYSSLAAVHLVRHQTLTCTAYP